MKQKDIALIIVVAAISAIISFFVSNMIFGGAKSQNQEVEVVQPIESSFKTPNKNYFNENAFDPTQSITIQQSDNTQPFSDTSSSQ